MVGKFMALIFLFGLAFCVTNATAATTTDRLVAACDQKTQKIQRVNGKLEKVGESLDSFCEGYLVSAFEVFSAQGAICFKDNAPRPEYLLSVFRTYIEANVDQRKSSAAVVLREAFRRAFPCK
jgi:hypothetical protein